MSDEALPAELERLTSELAQAKAELQEFTYIVSHDLRAPLRHIHAFAQIIEEDLPDAPPEILSHLATIRQSAQALTWQLDGLTTLSRLMLQSLNMQVVDVNALAREVADELTQQAAQPGVQWQLACDVPPVLADAQLLRQVLVHVLGNASKFSRGRLPAQITLGWQINSAGLCQISVRDNGVGFAPEQAGKLFKVFAKLHSSRDYDGLGLGLVSSRKILQRLGGSISIAATLSGGCCVVFDLQLAPHA
jgi:light-regulated signal transduction histidine kinase (bacteriophytochrome)